MAGNADVNGMRAVGTRYGFIVAYLKARVPPATVCTSHFDIPKGMSAWLAARPKGTLDPSRTLIMPRWGIVSQFLSILAEDEFFTCET